jgi:Family of unknown function (DUF5993)
MDTIIFILILATLLAMNGRRRWLVLTLFLIACLATLGLFAVHATDRLGLNF